MKVAVQLTSTASSLTINNKAAARLAGACFALQDADLLLLSLLCHEPYFIVMRENMEAGVSSMWEPMPQPGMRKHDP